MGVNQAIPVLKLEMTVQVRQIKIRILFLQVLKIQEQLNDTLRQIEPWNLGLGSPDGAALAAWTVRAAWAGEAAWVDLGALAASGSLGRVGSLGTEGHIDRALRIITSSAPIFRPASPRSCLHYIWRPLEKCRLCENSPTTKHKPLNGKSNVQI